MPAVPSYRQRKVTCIGKGPINSKEVEDAGTSPTGSLAEKGREKNKTWRKVIQSRKGKLLFPHQQQQQVSWKTPQFFG